MKLWLKLTLAISLIVVTLFSVFSYLVGQQSLDFAMSQISRQYRLQHVNYRIFIEREVYENEAQTGKELQTLFTTVQYIAGLNHTALYTAAQEPLYSSLAPNTDTTLIADLITLQDGYLTRDAGEEFVLGAVSTFTIDGHEYYFLTVNSSIDIWLQREELQQQARFLSVVLLGCVLFSVGAFVKHITRPLEKLSQSSERIAAGSYSQRTGIASRDEVGVLAGNFDKMAAAIAEKIDRLEQAVQAREEFVASFSHELKTPMTAIMGYADMLRSHENSPQVQIKAADYIYTASKRLTELSLKLLDLMGLAAEHIVWEPVAVERLRCESSHLRWDLQPTILWIDKTLISSLLENLCRNAEQAAATEIVVRGRVEGDRYRIWLQDNGRGMSAAEIDRIKEPFYRAGLGDGFGLGLALAERIAMLHGTSLTFQSEIGVGTTVQLTLPLHKPTA